MSQRFQMYRGGMGDAMPFVKVTDAANIYRAGTDTPAFTDFASFIAAGGKSDLSNVVQVSRAVVDQTKAAIRSYYLDYLGREPDAAGVDLATPGSWVAQVLSGKITLEQARQAIYGSNEAVARRTTQGGTVLPGSPIPDINPNPPGTSAGGDFFSDTLFTLPVLNVPVTGTMALVGGAVLYFLMSGSGGKKGGWF